MNTCRNKGGSRRRQLVVVERVIALIGVGLLTIWLLASQAQALPRTAVLNLPTAEEPTPAAELTVPPEESPTAAEATPAASVEMATQAPTALPDLTPTLLTQEPTVASATGELPTKEPAATPTDVVATPSSEPTLMPTGAAATPAATATPLYGRPTAEQAVVVDISMAASVSSIEQGEEVEYVLLARSSAGLRSLATVTSELPPSFALLAAGSTAGSCEASANRAVCRVSLDAQNPATVVIRALVGFDTPPGRATGQAALTHEGTSAATSASLDVLPPPATQPAPASTQTPSRQPPDDSDERPDDSEKAAQPTVARTDTVPLAGSPTITTTTVTTITTPTTVLPPAGSPTTTRVPTAAAASVPLPETALPTTAALPLPPVAVGGALPASSVIAAAPRVAETEPQPTRHAEVSQTVQLPNTAGKGPSLPLTGLGLLGSALIVRILRRRFLDES